MWAEASGAVQIVQGVLTFISTVVVAFLAYKTAQLQTQATVQAAQMRAVNEKLVEVKSATDGITQRLVAKAEEKGVERGRREEIEKKADGAS